MSKKKKTIQDPYAEREAQKYEHPVPSRAYILQYLNDLGRPASFKHLQKALEITSAEEQEGLSRRLKAMLRDGQLMTDRRERYCLLEKLDLIPGRVVGHPDGFGFVVPDSGGDDLYLSAKQMRSVLHGDRVLVQQRGLDRRGRPEGIVMEVIERNTQQIVGRLFNEKGVAFVEPDNKRISQDVLIPQDQTGGAEPGQIVMVELVAQPSKKAQPLGKVIDILGEHMAPGMEIDIALRSHALPYVWPPEVLNEIQTLSEEVAEQDKKGRTDLRHLPFVTIDGEDAKDFDDAVYCERRKKAGWKLYVAIADVSHYVNPETALDIEAKERGNSVYFPERVIPMLPEALSNGLCSLKPNVDRLCMVCEMAVSASGKLERYRFYEAVMHSKARLTYTKVAAILIENDVDLQQQYQHLWPHLQELYALYQTLHAEREKRGAIDFDTVETRIVFGESKKIEKIIPVERNDAHRLIEECMLLANVATAKFLQKNKIPALYRVHDKPADEKIENIREFLGELGLQLTGGKHPKPGDYSKLLHAIKSRDDAELIQKVMLYSLSQAVYQPENIGHFGLAYPAYAHFTSPIRRYPDLLVHRAIRHLLQHREVGGFRYNKEQMHQLGTHCSMTERRADEATWDVIAWLKCEFMLDKVGEVFYGKINSVTNFGIFITLEEFYVEGLVHVTALQNDYYHFDAAKHRLVGERTHTSYRLGDRLQVQVVRVDLDERKIDFELA